MNLSQARENMIEQQIRPWDVLDPRVLNVLSEIPRDRFATAECRALAYSDYPLPIGHGQTMLKPNVDGRILQSLNIKTTDQLLEIGTGSGFLTACLASLGTKVESLEIIPALAQQALTRLNTLGIGNVTVLEQDAAQEWDAADAYDAIVFTGSMHSVPDFYRNKMAHGGRLFAVLGSESNPTMTATLLTRVTEREWSTETLFETRIPPLVNFALPNQPFQF